MNCITPPIYKRRKPQDTVLYQVVQNTFLEWSGNYSLRHDEVLPEYVEKEFKDYFKCGILVHGFARAYCANCSGDFINADVHIEESNRRGAERLIRYCARPAFSGEKLRLISQKAETADSTRLQYDVNKASQKTEPPLILTATELFDNLAKLIPPPHRHRHHYHGVLAPNSKQRAKVTEFANRYYRPDTAENRALQDDLKIEAAASKLIVKPPAKTGSKTWARLIAKVYEVDPVKCEGCGAEMKLIAFINDAISITKILTHLGEAVEAPKMQRARPPPEVYQVENEIEGYHETEYHYDQTLNW